MPKAGELNWEELYKTGKIEQEPIDNPQIQKLSKMPVKTDYHKTGDKPTEEDLKRDTEKIMKGWVGTAEAQWKDDDHLDTEIVGPYAELDERNWGDPNTAFEQLTKAEVTGDTAIEWNGREPLTKNMSKEEYDKWRMATDE